MTTEKTELAPYLPFATFLSGLEILGQGLPPTLDRSVWSSRDGSTQSQLFKAMKFFHLIDDEGNVLPELQELVNDVDDRPGKLAQLLRAAYPKAITLGEVNGSRQQLEDVLGEYGLTGATRRKAETFYLQAAEFAGLPISAHWPSTKKRATTGRSRRATPKRHVNANTNGAANGTAPKGSTRTIQLESGGTMTLSVSVDIMALSSKDRTFMFKVIDELSDYEQKSDVTEPSNAVSPEA